MVIMAEDGSNRIPLQYEGPRTIEELWADDAHRDMRMVKVGTSKVLRTRPRFPDWSISFRVAIDEEVMDLHTFTRVSAHAGRLIGLAEAAEGNRSRFAVEIERLGDVDLVDQPVVDGQLVAA
jgi:hypothetical protein